MSAGLSNKQIYNRLQTIKRQLERAGVTVIYRKRQLVRFEAEGTHKIGGFNISFEVLHARNGECARTPVVYITGTPNHLEGRYGGRDFNHGTFEQGLEAVINLFSEVHR